MSQTSPAHSSEPLRYTPPASGICAIDPRALEVIICEPPQARAPYSAAGGKATVVEVNGALCYAHPFLDTYEAIRERFALALAAAPETIVLKVNSPGGDVAGAFDTARYMRTAAAAAGKRLVGFTESQACSAGYALISAAPEIVVSDTGTLGSIGVINCIENKAQALAAIGVRYHVIASGARKADGNPNIPLTEDAANSIQGAVNSMAERFFALVSDHRGERCANPQALEAGVKIGADAVAAGLADRVEGWDSFLASLSVSNSGAIPAGEAPSSASNMPDDEKDDKSKAKSWRAAAEAAAKDGDEDAKKALAALSAKAGDPDDEEDKKAVRAADDSDPPKDDEKASRSAAAAQAATAAQASALAAQLAAQSAELAALKAESAERKAKADAEARAAVFASRPDLTPEAIKALANVATSELAAVLGAIPRAGTLAHAPLVGAAHAVEGVTYLSSPEQCAHLDKIAGLAPEKRGVVNQGVEQIFGAPLPKGSK